MSKKKAKDLVLESPGVSVEECNKDITVINSEEFQKYPITMPIEECKIFSITKSEPIKTTPNTPNTPKKPSSERKRRLRLLK